MTTGRAADSPASAQYDDHVLDRTSSVERFADSWVDTRIAAPLSSAVIRSSVTSTALPAARGHGDPVRLRVSIVERSTRRRYLSNVVPAGRSSAAGKLNDATGP